MNKSAFLFVAIALTFGSVFTSSAVLGMTDNVISKPSNNSLDLLISDSSRRARTEVQIRRLKNLIVNRVADPDQAFRKLKQLESQASSR